MHAPDRSPSPPARQRGRAWLGLAALACYAVFLWQHTSLQPGGADSSGYFNMTRALTEEQLRTPARTLEGLPVAEMPAFTYQPLGFHLERERGTLIPTYPFGLPLLYAAGETLGGTAMGPKLLMVAHALVGLLLTFGLARQLGAGPFAALLAAALLAASPLYVQYSIQAMSDMPALVWCAAALWLAARGSVATAAGAGFAVGLAVLIRPSNLLVLPAALLLLRRRPADWIALGAGGVPAAAALLAFNQAAYGSPFLTGYGQVGALFSLEWIPVTLRHYAQWLPAVISPLLLAIPAAGWRETGLGGPRLVHGSFAIAVLGFYVGYYHTHETWWYLRFILPAAPSLLVLGVLGLERLWRRRPPTPGWRAVAVTVALLALAQSVHWNRHFATTAVGLDERLYVEAVRLVQERTPDNAVVLTMQTSGALFHGTDRILVRWDMLENSWPRVRAAAVDAGRPIYAVLFEFEVNDARERLAPDRWEKLEQIRHLSFWRLTPANP